jgi:hypothetical protein
VAGPATGKKRGSEGVRVALLPAQEADHAPDGLVLAEEQRVRLLPQDRGPRRGRLALAAGRHRGEEAGRHHISLHKLLLADRALVGCRLPAIPKESHEGEQIEGDIAVSALSLDAIEAIGIEQAATDQVIRVHGEPGPQGLPGLEQHGQIIGHRQRRGQVDHMRVRQGQREARQPLQARDLEAR